MARLIHSYLILYNTVVFHHHRHDLHHHLHLVDGIVDAVDLIVRFLNDSSLPVVDVIEYILDCAIELPWKTHVYALLVGLLNMRSTLNGENFVMGLTLRMKDALCVGDYLALKMLMRMYTALVRANVIVGEAVCKFLNLIVSNGALKLLLREPDSSPFSEKQCFVSAEQRAADMMVKCVIQSLPWFGEKMKDISDDTWSDLKQNLQTYFSTRRKRYDPALRILPQTQNTYSTTTPENYAEDEVAELWTAAEGILSEKKCDLKIFPSDYAEKLESLLNTESGIHMLPEQFLAELSHDDTYPFPSLPSQKEDIIAMYPLKTRLRLLPKEKTDVGISLMDRIIVEDFIVDTIFRFATFDGMRTITVDKLKSMPVSFDYQLILSEVLFNQILAMPSSPQKLLSYTVLIVELCKSSQAEMKLMPAAIATTVVKLYNEEMTTIDLEAILRLSDWLAHHLSLTGFQWPWEDFFGDAASLPQTDLRRVFVENVLTKLLRLSYFERIAKFLPATMKDLLPPKPVAFLEKKDSSDSREASVARLIADKRKSAALDKWRVDEQNNAKKENTDDDPDKVMKDTLIEESIDTCLIRAILRAGSKTYTHTIAFLEKYLDVLQKIKPAILLRETSSIWRNSSHHMILTFDRLMALRLASNLDVITWLFESAQGFSGDGLAHHAWEVLTGAANKTVGRAEDFDRDATAIHNEALSMEDLAGGADHRFREAAEYTGIDLNVPDFETRLNPQLQSLRRDAEMLRDKALFSQTQAKKAHDSFLKAHEEMLDFFKVLLSLFKDYLTEKLAEVAIEMESAQVKWVLSHLRCVSRKYRREIIQIIRDSNHKEATAEDDTDGDTNGDGYSESKPIVIDFDIEAVDERIKVAIEEGLGISVDKNNCNTLLPSSS